jgi:hypothetical protein
MMPVGVDPGGVTDDRLVAARQRVEAFIEDLDHVGIEDVGLVSLPASDTAARSPARQAAVSACEAAGLGRCLADAREQARTRVIRMYDRNSYQPTWAGLNWGRSLGTVEDRVAIAAAIEDAAIGTVATGVSPPDIVETLLEPMRLVVSLHVTDGPRSQFAGTGWTIRTGAVLYLLFVATTVVGLGVLLGPIGWILALGIVLVAGLAILRDRSAR